MRLWLVSALAVTQTAIPLTVVSTGAISGIEQPREVVVRTAEAWQALWNEHRPGTAAPAVDFSAARVVGVFLGRRPTGGFQVEITEARRAADGVVVVVYAERAPPPGAFVTQALTAPFQLVAIPAGPDPIRFRRDTTGAGPPVR